MPKIGFHAPIKGGLHNALLVARDTGCETVQLFLELINRPPLSTRNGKAKVANACINYYYDCIDQCRDASENLGAGGQGGASGAGTSGEGGVGGA